MFTYFRLLLVSSIFVCSSFLCQLLLCPRFMVEVSLPGRLTIIYKIKRISSSNQFAQERYCSWIATFCYFFLLISDVRIFLWVKIHFQSQEKHIIACQKRILLINSNSLLILFSQIFRFSSYFLIPSKLLV